MMIPVLLLGILFPSFSPAASTCGFPAAKHPPGWSAAQFYAANGDPSAGRELQVLAEVLRGNIPDRLRSFVPVRFAATVGGEDVTIQVSVAPDYLSIGTDADAVRTPLTNYAAQYLASKLGYSLPTTYLVDQIYAHADTQLLPQPTNWYNTPGAMRSGAHYVVFQKTVEAQRKGRGGLVAGHKKDVVLTNRLDANPGHVAIYGWQNPGNHPIQPLTTVHDFSYEDYSHGIRFLGPTLTVTNTRTGEMVPWQTAQALLDPELGAVLNGGQALHDARAAHGCSADFAAAVGLSAATCPPVPANCSDPQTFGVPL